MSSNFIKYRSRRINEKDYIMPPLECHAATIEISDGQARCTLNIQYHATMVFFDDGNWCLINIIIAGKAFIYVSIVESPIMTVLLIEIDITGQPLPATEKNTITKHRNEWFYAYLPLSPLLCLIASNCQSWFCHSHAIKGRHTHQNLKWRVVNRYALAARDARQGSRRAALHLADSIVDVPQLMINAYAPHAI